MLKWLKIKWYKRKLNIQFNQIQAEAAEAFKIREKNIKRGQDFHETCAKLEALGIENPKALVIGERPPTGRIKPRKK